MRILVLVTDGFGGYGGIAKFNQDLLNSLCSHPAIGEVIALPRLLPEPPGRLPMKLDYNTSGVGGKIRYTMAVLKSAIGHRKPAVIFCAHINLLPVAFALRLICRAPIVLIIHGTDAWQPTGNWLVNHLARKVDALISVSEVTKGRFLKWAGNTAGKVFILPNAVDFKRFGPGPKNAALQDRYGLRGRRVLLTVARLSAQEQRYKGIDQVIEVLPELAKQIPNLTYLLVGDGTDRARLEQKAVACGVRDRVVFAGRISEDEKADHYRLADAFVMAGWCEGFGIVYLEALACGVPVVGSKVDGSRETLRDGALGVLVDPTNNEEILQGILKALHHPRQVPPGLDYFSIQNFEQRGHDIINALRTS